MDKAIQFINDWKEKLLFLVVVLLALSIAFKPNWMGEDIPAVYNEEYTKAINSTGIEGALASDAIEMLNNPPEVMPQPPNPDEVSRIHFSPQKRYMTGGQTSGWMLTKQVYEQLPALSLPIPNFVQYADFDQPAGPRPLAAKARGVVPRDSRPVSLTEKISSDFGE